MKVLITGGSGRIASHLIPFLQKHSHDAITAIITLDRRPASDVLKFDQQNSTEQSDEQANVEPTTEKIPILHRTLDLIADPIDRLEEAFDGVHAVIHLARKSMEYLFQSDQKSLNECYWSDNYKATEMLLRIMFKKNVGFLVFVGDSYANLPSGDNFGSGETIHSELPSTYMLGEYGRSVAEAEMIARNEVGKVLQNGQTFRAIFLRPTFIYGERCDKLWRALKAIALSNNRTIDRIETSSSGMLQYIYAGNLAWFIEKAMRILLQNAEKYSGDIVYCMDGCCCQKFNIFCKPFLDALDIELDSVENAKNIYLLRARTYASEFLYTFLGKQPKTAQMNICALRLLFCYCIGFSHRKQSLLLGNSPATSELNEANTKGSELTENENQDEFILRTIKWLKETSKK